MVGWLNVLILRREKVCVNIRAGAECLGLFWSLQNYFLQTSIVTPPLCKTGKGYYD